MPASAPALDVDRPRQDPVATLAALQCLDLHLVDCDGSVARGILLRAIAHLEASLLVQLTGPGRA